MSSLVWIVECEKHLINIRFIKKSQANQLYTKHVKKDGCLEVKEPYFIIADERFTIS